MKKNKFAAFTAAATLSLLISGQPVNVFNNGEVALAATALSENNQNIVTEVNTRLNVRDAKNLKFDKSIFGKEIVKWSDIEKNRSDLNKALRDIKSKGYFVISKGNDTFKYHQTGRLIYSSTNTKLTAKEQKIFYLINYKMDRLESDGKVYVKGKPYSWNAKNPDYKHVKNLVALIYKDTVNSKGTFAFKYSAGGLVVRYNEDGTKIANSDPRIAQYEATLAAEKAKKAAEEKAKKEAAAKKAAEEKAKKEAAAKKAAEEKAKKEVEVKKSESTKKEAEVKKSESTKKEDTVKKSDNSKNEKTSENNKNEKAKEDKKSENVKNENKSDVKASDLTSKSADAQLEKLEKIEKEVVSTTDSISKSDIAQSKKELEELKKELESATKNSNVTNSDKELLDKKIKAIEDKLVSLQKESATNKKDIQKNTKANSENKKELKEQKTILEKLSKTLDNLVESLSGLVSVVKGLFGL